MARTIAEARVAAMAAGAGVWRRPGSSQRRDEAAEDGPGRDGRPSDAPAGRSDRSPSQDVTV